MSTDYGLLADFNYNDEGWQRELNAELVDQLALQASGILVQGFFNPSTGIDQNAGSFANFTQYPTIADTPQSITSNTALDIRDFSDYIQTAPWLNKADAWGIENLVQVIAGKDPIAELLRQLTNYWAKAIQASALSVIKGIMATALASTHSTGATYSGGEITLPGIGAAKQLLGDAQMQLTKAVMHSKAFSDAVQLGIASFPNSALGNNLAVTGAFPQIMGMTTWLDDAIAAVGGVYSSYFAAPGAVVYNTRPWTRRTIANQIVKSAGIDVEFWRDPSTGGGTDVIYTRLSYVIGALGMEYNSATTNPTDVQLATGSNWTKRADDDRKIKIVELKTT